MFCVLRVLLLKMALILWVIFNLSSSFFFMSQEEKRNKNVVVLKLVLGDSILILVPNVPFENVFFNLISSFSFLLARKKKRKHFLYVPVTNCE